MIKDKFYKGVASALCALLLSLSIMSAYSIDAMAAGTVTHANLYKLVDMSLAKTGIVANNEIINSIKGTIWADYLDIIDQYKTYLEETYGNALENMSVDSFSEFLNAKGIIESVITDVILSAIAMSLDIWSVTVETIGDLFIDVDPGTGILPGIGYNIPDVTVEHIKNEFDELVTTGEFGYYYIDTYKPSEIPVSWVDTATSYSNLKAYCQSSEFNTVFSLTYSSNGLLARLITLDNASNTLIVRPYTTVGSTQLYNDNWTLKETNCVSSDSLSVNFTDSESLTALRTGSTYSLGNTYIDLPVGKSATVLRIVSNDGSKQIVYTSLDALKMYNGGTKPYYQVTTNDYSTEVDNSIDFTGEYYQDNSSVYTYETIQNEIDNSTEINEETINNIVNTSTSTIINNYYTDSGSGGSDGDGIIVDTDGVIDDITDVVDVVGDIWDGALGAVGGLLSVVVDGLELVLNPLREATELITGILNGVQLMINDLETTFVEFSQFLGAMFSFIPVEIMNLIKASIGVIVGVSVYKWFFK